MTQNTQQTQTQAPASTQVQAQVQTPAPAQRSVASIIKSIDCVNFKMTDEFVASFPFRDTTEGDLMVFKEHLSGLLSGDEAGLGIIQTQKITSPICRVVFNDLDAPKLQVASTYTDLTTLDVADPSNAGIQLNAKKTGASSGTSVFTGLTVIAPIPGTEGYGKPKGQAKGKDCPEYRFDILKFYFLLCRIVIAGDHKKGRGFMGGESSIQSFKTSQKELKLGYFTEMENVRTGSFWETAEDGSTNLKEAFVDKLQMSFRVKHIVKDKNGRKEWTPVNAPALTRRSLGSDGTTILTNSITASDIKPGDYVRLKYVVNTFTLPDATSSTPAGMTKYLHEVVKVRSGESLGTYTAYQVVAPQFNTQNEEEDKDFLDEEGQLDQNEVGEDDVPF